jgi:hypothetical protein
MTWHWDWWLFWLGALGALTPEAIRLYKLATDKGTFTWTWLYLIMSVIFAGIGGVIAVILPATSLLSAVYAGAAWPALVAAGAKALPGGGGVHKAEGLDAAGPEPPTIGSYFRAL